MMALERERWNAGLSVEDAARMVGISTESLRRYERTGRRPPIVVLEQLAELYSTSVEALLEPSAVPPPLRRDEVEMARERGLLPSQLDRALTHGEGLVDAYLRTTW